MLPEFKSFRKIPRLSREIIITEKIDGTNGIVHVSEDGSVTAGRRNEWLRPGEQDNYGFRAWVEANTEELRKLGPGYHFGEWWGKGIQRGYGLTERRFSLFNVEKWGEHNTPPKCCHVVPLIQKFDVFDTDFVRRVISVLKIKGSFAAPGFMRPEGVIVFHPASGQMFKKTLENDEKPKFLQEAA